MNLRLLNTTAYLLCLMAPWSLLWLDSGLLFPYTTGKAWVFRSLVELAFTLCLIDFLIRPQALITLPPKLPAARLFVFTLGAFIGWAALTAILGIDFFRSFWSNWERMSGLLAYLHWALYLLCLLWVLTRERAYYLLLNLVVVIALVGAFGMLDATDKRSISTLGNPIYLGNLAVFGLFIGSWLMVTATPGPNWRKQTVRVLVPLAMFIMSVALFRSAARGAVLALLVGVVAAIFGLTLAYVRQRGRIAVVASVSLVMLAGAGLIVQFDTLQQAFRESDIRLLQRLGQISSSNQTTADRFENWRIAYDAAKQYPLTGWGQENYMIAFNEHYRPGVMDNAQIWFDRAHNAYLDQLVASGVPGLLIYLLLLALPMLLVWQVPGASRAQKSVLTGLFAAYLAKNIVGFDTFSSSLVWIIAVACLLTWLCEPREANGKLTLTFRSSALIAVLLALGAGSIYWLNIHAYLDNQRFASLMNNPRALRSAQLAGILAEPVSSLRYAQNARLAILDKMLVGASKRVLTTGEKSRYEQTLQRAGQMIDEELRIQPGNYRVRYNGALLYARLGQYERAAAMIEELTRAAPQRTVFWHLLSQVYAVQGNSDGAAQARAHANQLNPDWKPGKAQ